MNNKRNGNTYQGLMTAGLLALMLWLPVMTAGAAPETTGPVTGTETAYAETEEPTKEPETATVPETHEIELPIDDSIFTPDGNMSLIDDVQIVVDSEVIEILTVNTRNGNVFYLIIDRSGGEDSVHFLNQVDESDLLALLSDDEKAEYESSKAAEESRQESIRAEEESRKAQTETEDLPAAIQQPSGSDNTVILLGILAVLVVILIGGSAFAVISLIRKKGEAAKKKTSEQYDYMEDLLGDASFDQVSPEEDFPDEEILDAADMEESEPEEVYY